MLRTGWCVRSGSPGTRLCGQQLEIWEEKDCAWAIASPERSRSVAFWSHHRRGEGELWLGREPQHLPQGCSGMQSRGLVWREES